MPAAAVRAALLSALVAGLLGGDALAGITVPGNVTKIGGGAFSGCASLKNVTILFDCDHLYHRYCTEIQPYKRTSYLSCMIFLAFSKILC